MKKLLVLMAVVAVVAAACRGAQLDQGLIGQVLGRGATATARPVGTLGPTRTPSATRTAVPSPTFVAHVVQAGETLERIAVQYRVTAEAIAMRNALGGIGPVAAGQVLAIPERYNLSPSLSWGMPSGSAAGRAPVAASPTPRNLAPSGEPQQASTPTSTSASSTPRYHVVQPGDTLNAIAQLYGVTASEIARLNSLSDPNLIHVGQILQLSNAWSIPSATRTAVGYGVSPSPTRTAVTHTPRPAVTPQSIVPPRDCCKYCCKGKPCGNTCISRDYTCHTPPGCACWAPGCGP